MGLGIKKKIKSALRLATGCSLLYKTQWYKQMFVGADHETYPDNVWYRNHDERNFDVVNLGSSGGKWAFDYTDTGIKGMNWAQQPQTLLEDFNLLRHYHSILRENGYVLITIMPFTGLNKSTGLRDAMKYLKIETQGKAIQPYMYKEAQRYAEFPILFGKPAIKALLKYLLGREAKPKTHPSTFDKNLMNEEQLQQDAKRWMNGWKNQFSIDDFEAPLTEQNQHGRDYRINLMRELIDFCRERSYQPVYVIPPVTEYLAKEFTPKFRQIYIYDYLKQVDRDIPLLDYSDNKELMEKDLYFNSFFLNQRGAKLFTHRVLKDLGLLNEAWNHGTRVNR